MKKLKCYYAHSMLSYDSTIEKQDIELLEKLGFEVENPNQKKHQKGCDKYAKDHGRDKIMDYFTGIVKECDIVAFRALPDGYIFSGISFELQVAEAEFMPIIELPCSIQERMMDYAKTKKYLIELGHYKI